MKNSIPWNTSPFPTKNKAAVKHMANILNPIRNFFLEWVKSATVPRIGEMMATTMAAIATESPQSLVPSAPPTTTFLKNAE